MEILVLSSLPQDSGCFLRAKYLADGLAQAGHRTTLAMEPKGISFLLHMLLSFVRNIFLVLFSKADVGICIKPYPNTLWPLLLRRFFRRDFFVVTDIDDLDYGYRKGFLSRLSRILQLPFPQHCNLVTYHNDNLFRHIRENFHVPENRLYRLDQGVDFNIYGHTNETATAELRKKIVSRSGMQNPVLLAYSAHLNIASDLDDIFTALSETYSSFPQFYLVIAGGGPMLEEFQQHASLLPFAQQIHFTGHLSPQDVSLHLAAADYGLVYYADKHVNYYRTSMKIREYLALGMDVICNNVGDLKEFGNLTFQSGPSSHEFAVKIVEVLKEQKRLPASLKNSYIRSKYDWKTIAEAFAHILQKSI